MRSALFDPGGTGDLNKQSTRFRPFRDLGRVCRNYGTSLERSANQEVHRHRDAIKYVWRRERRLTEKRWPRAYPVAAMFHEGGRGAFEYVRRRYMPKVSQSKAFLALVVVPFGIPVTLATYLCGAMYEPVKRLRKV